MSYSEDDYLMISGIQHFKFCIVCDPAAAVLFADVEQLPDLQIGCLIYRIIVGTANRQILLQFGRILSNDLHTEIFQLRKYQLDLCLPDSSTHDVLQVCDLDVIFLIHAFRHANRIPQQVQIFRCQQCVFTLSHAGYCKRVPASTYRSQKRGGRGVTGMTTKEEDFVEGVFTASTHDYILFFTNLGKVHRRKGYQIPEAGRTAKGTNLVNILPFEPGEKVTAGITVHEFDEDYLVFVTRNGTVKRLELASLNTARKAGIRALTLSEGDELIAVMKTDGKQDILLASANGMVICFNENDVRVMGRDAAGVRGIALDADDYVVGAGIAAEGKQLLTVTENGYGKRTEIEEYLRLGEDGARHPQQRGGKGLKNYNLTAKTGLVAGVAIVEDGEDVMLVENGGVLIRMPVDSINIYKRDTQGVILMRLEAGSRVISVDRVDREPEEPAENQNPEPEISTPDGNDFV